MPTRCWRERSTSAAAWTMVRTLLLRLDSDCIHRAPAPGATRPAGGVTFGDAQRGRFAMAEATTGAEHRPPSRSRPMTADEQAALLAGTPICNLACLDDDGHPYVVPVWFEYGDGGFYLVVRARAAWGRFLQRD